MGDVYRIQLEDLNKKVDELSEADRDDVAEVYKNDLMELRSKIRKSDEAKEELKKMIERARLAPLEYLLFDLRVVKNTPWAEIVKRIDNAPELVVYRRNINYYRCMLKNGMEKLRACG